MNTVISAHRQLVAGGIWCAAITRSVLAHGISINESFCSTSASKLGLRELELGLAYIRKLANFMRPYPDHIEEPVQGGYGGS